MMSDQGAGGTADPADVGDDPLAAVRDAAVASIVAQVEDGDVDAATRRALDAARAALDAGHAISAIAAAEAQGQQTAREQAGAQLLRTVERTAKKQREALEEYEQAVARAVAIGLPTRDVAARAKVSHGTVGAIARRRAGVEASAASAEGTSEHGDSPADSPG